jgi:endonuclease/exonuclease/phosphatase family metal-dependent hydrolase
MEWLNDLFVSGNQAAKFRSDDEHSQHNRDSTVRQRRDDLAGVLKDLAPDLVVVVEGPSTQAELQLLFDTDVPGKWKVALQQTPGQSQNVGIAVRVDQGKFADPPLTHFDTNKDKAFDTFLLDTDGDGVKEQFGFERRPLYVEVHPIDGKAFRMLGLHLKSKGIFDAIEWSMWWTKADANRRKILAEAAHIRDGFLDGYLTQPATSHVPLVVCGDINDGPGMDASEKRLFGSGVERLMGSVWKPELCLGNALFDALSPRDKEELDFHTINTTSFADPIFNGVYQREWIDHVMYTRTDGGFTVSGGRVNWKMPDGRPIWEKYRHASDHAPVSVSITT